MTDEAMNEEHGVSLTVSTAAEMRALGRNLATALRAGDLVILSGGLGAGKTTLTQGIGAGLGVRGPVTSPTFVIARVHPPVPASTVSASTVSASTGPAEAGQPGAAQPDAMADLAAPRPSLVHADAYRLGSAAELDDLDLDTDTAASVTVVEWGEGMAEGLAADRLEISIAARRPPAAGAAADLAGEVEDPAADTPRMVRISMVGARWEGVELPLADVADRL